MKYVQKNNFVKKYTCIMYIVHSKFFHQLWLINLYLQQPIATKKIPVKSKTVFCHLPKSRVSDLHVERANQKPLTWEDGLLLTLKKYIYQDSSKLNHHAASDCIGLSTHILTFVCLIVCFISSKASSVSWLFWMRDKFCSSKSAKMSSSSWGCEKNSSKSCKGKKSYVSICWLAVYSLILLILICLYAYHYCLRECKTLRLESYCTVVIVSMNRKRVINLHSVNPPHRSHHPHPLLLPLLAW